MPTGLCAELTQLWLLNKAGAISDRQFAAAKETLLHPGAKPRDVRTFTAAEVARMTKGQEYVTIVGFGSLLSETSARGTCPDLRSFILGRVRGWRRVFRHPAAIFFERGIAIPQTKEISSLSAEPAEGDGGFVIAAFDVPAAQLPALLAREEEFNFALVPFWPLGAAADGPPAGEGWMCVPTTDAEVWRRDGIRARYVSVLSPHFGFISVWDRWGRHPGVDGVLPCPVYCRHCVLAAAKVSGEPADSFLDETFLCDRRTTLRSYLSNAPHVMTSRPPPSLIGRYSG